MIYIQYDWFVNRATDIEMVKWMNENLSEQPTKASYCDVYSFKNEGDAAFFMLTWGIKRMTPYEYLIGH